MPISMDSFKYAAALTSHETNGTSMVPQLHVKPLFCCLDRKAIVAAECNAWYVYEHHSDGSIAPALLNCQL